MLKKTIEYKDFLDEDRVDDFYFNISKAELLDLQIGTEGTFTERLKKIIESKDIRQTLDVFKTFVKDSYGIRTPDGRGFIKSEEAWHNFKGSGAYDVLFLSFFEDVTVMTEFVNGILPAAMVNDVNKEIAERVETPNGFRAGAETLPKSRRDQLAADTERLRGDADAQNDIPVYQAPAMTASDAAELAELRRRLAGQQDIAPDPQ